MKVVYKTSMVDKINEKIYEAKFLNKEIDKIILSPAEEADLRKELQLLYPYAVSCSPNEPCIQGGQIVEFNGIQIFVE